MDGLDILGFKIPVGILIPALIVGWCMAGWAMKRGLFAWLSRLAQKTSTDLDDVLLSALDRPLSLLILLSSLMIIPPFFVMPHLPTKFNRFFEIGLKATVILSVIMFLNRLLLGLVKSYTTKIEMLRISKGFSEVLVQAIVYSVGLLVLMDSMGVSITPILASLGVGSLAVALALQPTLENLISGFQIILDKPVVPGHFVKLESGEEGYIEKVGWRSTWLRELSNNMVIVPNKLMVNSRVRNYYYPERELAVLVNLGVHYNSDLEKVERVTSEVGDQIMKTVQGGVPEFKTFIRYNKLDSSSVNFTVILRAKEFVDNYLIQHEFIKAVVKRYAQEKIIIPYPIQAINTTQEGSQVEFTNGQKN